MATSSSGTAPSTAGRTLRARRRSSRARCPSRARSRGPIAHRGPGQQRQQVGVGRDVVEQRQGGDDLGDLGQTQQTLSPTISTGISRSVEGVEDGRGVRVVAGQHPDLAPDRVAGSRSVISPCATRTSVASQASSSSCVSCRAPRRRPRRKRVRLGLERRRGRGGGRQRSAASWLATSRMRSSERRLTRQRERACRAVVVRRAGRPARTRGCWRPTPRASRRWPGWGPRPRSPGARARGRGRGRRTAG